MPWASFVPLCVVLSECRIDVRWSWKGSSVSGIEEGQECWRQVVSLTSLGTRSSAQGNCSAKSFTGNAVNSSLSSLSSLGGPVGAGGVQQGGGGWGGRWGRGRGQGTFHPHCHVLHYHMVLRLKGLRTMKWVFTSKEQRYSQESGSGGCGSGQSWLTSGMAWVTLTCFASPGLPCSLMSFGGFFLNSKHIISWMGQSAPEVCHSHHQQDSSSSFKLTESPFVSNSLCSCTKWPLLTHLFLECLISSVEPDSVSVEPSYWRAPKVSKSMSTTFNL